MYFSLGLLPLVLPLDTTEKSLALFLYTQIRYPSMLLRIPPNPTHIKVKQPQPSASPTMSDAPINLWFLWQKSLPWTGWSKLMSLLQWRAQRWAWLSRCGFTRLSEESPLIYWPCSSLMQQQQLPLLQKQSLVHVQLVVYQDICLMSSSTLMASSSCSFL